MRAGGGGVAAVQVEDVAAVEVNDERGAELFSRCEIALEEVFNRLQARVADALDFRHGDSVRGVGGMASIRARSGFT